MACSVAYADLVINDFASDFMVANEFPQSGEDHDEILLEL